MKIVKIGSLLALLDASLLFGAEKANAASELRLNSPEKKRVLDENQVPQQRRRTQTEKLPITTHEALSFVNPNYPGFAFDEDPNTRWESVRTDDQWIYAGLPQAYDISRVDILWEAAYATEYVLEVSNDTISWTEAERVTKNNDDPDSITISPTQVAQFVRMRGISRAREGWPYSLFLISIFGDPGDGYDQPPSQIIDPTSATASTEASPTLSADKAIDGNVNTRWASVSGSGIQWIYVNLGNKRDLFEVIINWDSDYADQYVIEVSDDAQTWYQRAQEFSGNGGTDSFTLPPDTEGQYVRMLASSSATKRGYSITEFSVRGGITLFQDPPTATIISAAASSVEDGTSYVPSLVFDGDFVDQESRWSSDRTDDQWIYVAFDQIYDINEVKIYWETAYGKDFKVQSKVSLSESSWTDRATVTDATGGIDTIPIPGLSRNAKFVRILGIERGTQWGYSILELEVGATPARGIDPTPTPPSTPQPTPQSTPNPTVSNSVYLTRVEAVASSVETQNNGLNVALNVIDGLPNTRWASKRSDGQWIYVKLDQNYFLTSVEFDWDTAHAAVFEVQVSDDANTWTTKVTVSNGNGGNDIITLPASTRGQYVRMVGIDRATRYGYSLYEIRVKGIRSNTDPPQSPVAQSTPQSTPNPTVSNSAYLTRVEAVASSVETQNNGLNVASNVIDGLRNTRWASLRTDGQWIYVKLDRNYFLTSVEFDWEAAHAAVFDVQVSGDANSWTTKVTVSNGNGGNEIITLPASTRGQYVRMVGIDRATRFGYSLWEIRVKGIRSNTDPPQTPVSTPAPTPTFGNPVRLQRINAVASSVEFPQNNGENIAARAIDGDLSTRWASLRSDPQSITVELDNRYELTNVELNWEAAYGSGYEIQVSDDGSSWTTVFSTTSGDGGIDLITLPVNTFGRFVRMYGFARGSRYGFSLYEMYVLGR